MPEPPEPRVIPQRSERLIVFLVGAVQFINILDFVMVMPLGPDFARDLGIPSSQLGFIGGSYTAAAAVSGLAGSFFLDRFDRRKALAVAMLGLVVGTAAGGFATGLPTLLAARVLAGLFGGPATSLSFSIIADVIPASRRGKAMGAVMGAFSVASVVGVPAGLELARVGSWRLPFLGVAALGVAVSVMVIYLLPPMRLHLEARAGEPMTRLSDLFRKPLVRLSYLMTAVVMMSGFIIIPIISPYVQENLGFPREHLSSLYLGGGIISFFATRLGGVMVDRYGSFATGTVGVILLLFVNYVMFIAYTPAVPLIALFMGFMLAMGIRNVAYNTLTSKVPSLQERARFASIQSAVQHAASAIGAFLAAQMLTERDDRTLEGVVQVALLAMVLSATVPFFLWRVERGLGGERSYPPRSG